MEIEVNVNDRILKPVNEVFAAVVDPAKMSHYFISGASGPMKAGTKVEWEFADVGPICHRIGRGEQWRTNLATWFTLRKKNVRRSAVQTFRARKLRNH